MKNKIILITVSITLLITGALLLFKHSKQRIKKRDTITISILQTASHPALDAVREGFKQNIITTFGNKVEFIVQNAQGSVINAHTAAQHFHSNKDIDLFFAIATPALQALAQEEKERSIIFSAVTDPKVLGITEHDRNITGVTDRVDVKKEIEAMITLLPNIKSVAIIFNPGEINSTTLAQEMIIELDKSGITLIKVGISSEAEIATAVSSALRKADALLAPTDNMVASAITIIAHEAQKTGKPFIVSDNLLVEKGALMARGVDYFASGKKASEIAHEVIVNKKVAQELPFAHPEETTIVINKKIVDELRLTIPKELKNFTLVNGQ